MSDLDLNLDLNLDLDLDLDADPTQDRVADGLERAAQIAHPSQVDTTTFPAEDPDLPTDQANQLGWVLQEMRGLARHAQERMEANTSTAYFLTIVFLDHRQVDAFLEQTGWNRFGAPHLDGLALAEHLGVTLPPSAYDPYELHADKRLVDENLVMDLPDLE